LSTIAHFILISAAKVINRIQWVKCQLRDGNWEALTFFGMPHFWQ